MFFFSCSFRTLVIVILCSYICLCLSEQPSFNFEKKLEKVYTGSFVNPFDDKDTTTVIKPEQETNSKAKEEERVKSYFSPPSQSFKTEVSWTPNKPHETEAGQTYTVVNQEEDQNDEDGHHPAGFVLDGSIETTYTIVEDLPPPKETTFSYEKPSSQKTTFRYEKPSSKKTTFRYGDKVPETTYTLVTPTPSPVVTSAEELFYVSTPVSAGIQYTEGLVSFFFGAK